MEFVIYPLAAIGAVAVVLLGAFFLMGLSRDDEERHIDQDTLVELPPLPPLGETQVPQRRY